MVDVLLIQPPISDFYLTRKRTIPYGLACIAAALEQSGFSVELFDALSKDKTRFIKTPEQMNYLSPFYGNIDRSPFALFHGYKHFGYSFQHIANIANKSGAFLVGISSLFTAYCEDAYRTAESVKAALPNCKIVLGGHHPTHMPRETIALPYIDYVLRGDAEESMPLLAEAIMKHKDPTKIPGIVCKDTHGDLTIHDPQKIKNLTRMPIPAHHLITNRYYRRNGKNAVVITASRGCPFRCSYCSLGSHSISTYRRRSVDHIIAEINAVCAPDTPGFIDFEDENLSYDKEWFISLLEQIRNRFGNMLPEIRAMNGLLPSTLDKTTIYAMHSTGFKTLNLSLGSSCPEQLQRFHRPDVIKHFDHALHIGEQLGMNAVGYIIAGAPYQKPESTIDDLLFLSKRRVLAGVSVFYPSPGSHDYRLCSTLGLLPPSFSLMRSSALPISHLTSRNETVTLLRLGRILNFLKYLIDQNISLKQPVSRKISEAKPGDRTITGIRLLNLFFQDGMIRGITSKGRIYKHATSENLTKLFIEGLSQARLLGHQSKRRIDGSEIIKGVLNIA